MSGAQLPKNSLPRGQRLVCPARIQRLPEYAEDVMRILGPAFNGLSFQHEGTGLLDIELGSFNEIAEIRLKEREILAAVVNKCGDRVPRMLPSMPSRMVNWRSCPEPVPVRALAHVVPANAALHKRRTWTAVSLPRHLYPPLCRWLRD